MTDWYIKAVPEDPARRRKLMIAAAIGVALVVVAGALLSSGTPESHVTEVAPTPYASLTPTTVFVHVAGSVNTPGVYELPADARVFDAIAAAGGITAKADGTSINLARIVLDGEQIIVVPRGSGQAPSLPGKLNINRATAAEFDTLPRVGPTLAERIVAFRDDNGPFASIDSLGDVPGIGDVTLDGFRDQLTL